MKKKDKCPFCNNLKGVRAKTCKPCFGKAGIVAKTKVKRVCVDCSGKLGDYYSTRCFDCSLKLRKGATNPNWKGGIKNRYLAERTSRRYTEWRIKVFDRDNFTCRFCGDNKGGNLVAHHILTFNNFSNQRFVVGNGLTLCKMCHINLHKDKNTLWIADRWFVGCLN